MPSQMIGPRVSKNDRLQKDKLLT